MRKVLLVLAALSAMLPLPAGAQSMNLDTPSLFGGRRKPPPDDSLPPPPFLSRPGQETAKPALQGSGAGPKSKTACRSVSKRVTVDGRTVTKRERVCG
jgi:hypothetical protein